VEPHVRLRPDEVSLFNDLIDYRERSHLAGRYDDEFLVAFVGNDGDLTHAGLSGSRRVSMRSLRRFEALGLLDVISRTDAAIAFDLVDGFREQWGRLLASSGADDSGSRPSPSTDSAPEPSADKARGIFISCSELQKAALARPFKALLAENGLRGFIVSDEPRPEGTWSPEEKVDAYLDRSNAVVVFATGDLEAGEDRYTRPNIGDEIGRARSKPHLRNRVCVLREHGVTLPSNINPAYESLEPVHAEEGFRRALIQLREWGFSIDRLPEAPATAARPSLPRPAGESARHAKLEPGDEVELLARAHALLPGQPNMGEMSLAVVLAGGPRQPIFRPAELEAPALAKQLTQHLLFGDPALFQAEDATKSALSGASLVIRQTRSWMALDAEGTMVVVRPVHRAGPRSGLSAVIEEDVRSDIEAVLRFAVQLLARVDPEERLTHVAPLVALIGASYGAWRSRAQHAASPNSMTMNIGASGRAAAHLSPPARSRLALARDAGEIAEDLTVLLRRAAIR
jgi:hypothetical protein